MAVLWSGIRRGGEGDDVMGQGDLCDPTRATFRLAGRRNNERRRCSETGDTRVFLLGGFVRVRAEGSARKGGFGEVRHYGTSGRAIPSQAPCLEIFPLLRDQEQAAQQQFRSRHSCFLFSSGGLWAGESGQRQDKSRRGEAQFGA